MATYTHEEVLEDGTKKVSIYDADSHKLLNYYHLNSKGEKHGLEVMYDSDGNVRRRCEYENGKKHGREVMYDSYGTVCCRSEYEKGKKHGYEYDYRGFASTRLYENGECVMFTCPPSEIKDFLKENVLCGKYILNICKKVEVTKKNGQYQHISASDGNYTVYSMTFNNNKEFNGWANSGAIEPRYTYKKGVLDGYIETDSLGVYNIEDRQEGKYTDGQFTGKKCISSKHSLAKKSL